jgi:hypothetical protein
VTDYSMSNPRRAASATASVRLAAPSFTMIEQDIHVGSARVKSGV